MLEENRQHIRLTVGALPEPCLARGEGEASLACGNSTGGIENRPCRRGGGVHHRNSRGVIACAKYNIILLFGRST